ncbi:MAG: sugar transporter sugar-binding protein [Bacillota bacterium]|jgi:putative multiple sugar transport system substrate-binding protein|nr:sugar transporter sugar-binding protein [Bacillota bacterium]
MKKLIALLMVLALVLSMAACGGGEKAPADNGGSDEAAMIGVSMPTQSLQRWNQDGSNMKAKLEEAGYKVDLQYGGDNDIPTQVAQIENMITEGCKVLVIAAIDGSSLTEVLKQAKEQNIPVIAYDRLIMNSDAVSYYATFDNYQVGVMQGQYIETALDLKNQKGPFNVELFTGDPADNNATFFFNGAMSVLQPYIDSGVLVVPSGQTTQAQVSTQDWKTENAQSRMENLITSNGYSPKGKKLDAVMCSNDSTALGVVNALVSSGYTKDDMPIVTGQDCDKPNVKNMLQGLQSMSVFKDTRTLADKVVGMVDSIVKGSEPEINDKETYDNGTGIIPSYLCAPVVGTIDNYKELLIDSGYYKESDIQ